MVCTDSAAATHELTDELRAARISFLMGFDLIEPVRAAILGLPEAAWRPAIRQDGEPREDAWVAEITDRLELGGWPGPRRPPTTTRRAPRSPLPTNGPQTPRRLRGNASQRPPRRDSSTQPTTRLDLTPAHSHTTTHCTIRARTAK